MSSLSNKRKHTFLSIEDKLEILRKLSKGESCASLAKIYGVGTSTISDIKAKKESLQRFSSKLDSQEGSQKRKTTRTAKNSALEDAMYICFTQRRSLEKTKRIYRKQMLRRLLLAERDEESVLQFVKNLSLKDAIYMVADAWGTLTDDNLKNAWKKLWPIPETPNQGQDEANSIGRQHSY
uniref:Uncharacterized protein n=1 Tax=Timema poppense TaxID=170557 RepID=A0A7R9CK28_TIMPO|nr:unnamed protein product [Timema poppensis]